MASSMLRGFLKVVVLKALAESPKSGYALMKYIEEKVGSKPSPGSIYPLLETLTKEHLIEGKGVGRTKEYKLTIEGKHKLENVEEKRNECLKSMLEGMKMMSALTGEDMSFPMAMVESIRKGEFPFKEANPEWDNLRNLMFVMWKTGVLKIKAPKVRKILSVAYKELKSL
ncbi:MAG: PadR family transcriptional regulator [Candidatus Woesearchaeota archaeon]